MRNFPSRFLGVPRSALGALGALALAPVVLNGCDGNDDGGPSGNPIPVGTPTATPFGQPTNVPTTVPTTVATTVPTTAPTTSPTSAPLGSAPLNFGNGQDGTFTISSLNNGQLSGFLQVNAPGGGSANLVKSRFPTLPPGRYAFTGRLILPRSYRVSGLFSGIPFTVSGELPTATLAGTYNLSAAGQTANGILPAGSIRLPAS